MFLGGSVDSQPYAIWIQTAKLKKDYEERTFGSYIFLLQLLLLVFSNSIIKDNNNCPKDTIITKIYWNEVNSFRNSRQEKLCKKAVSKFCKSHWITIAMESLFY